MQINSRVREELMHAAAADQHMRGFTKRKLL